MVLFKRRQLLIYFTLFHFIGYYIWLFFIGPTNETARTLGGDLFSITAPLVSSIILFLVYKRFQEKDCCFWLLISLGCFSYFIGEGIWIYYENYLHIEVPMPGWDDFFYMLQILFYLLAFFYKIRKNRRSLNLIKFIIDTWIIMTVAIVFSWHFIVQELFTQHYESTLQLSVTIGYLIGDLILLYCAISFYIGSNNFFPSKVLNIIIISLLVQVFADSVYLFYNVNHIYMSGSSIDPFWSLSLLLMGISGVYALEIQPDTGPEKKRQYSFKDNISLRLLLPYLCVILLFTIIVLQFKEINSLITGSAIAILLVLFRQIFTTIENQSLLFKYYMLTEQLEHKIEERTNELSSKNRQLTATVQKMKHMAFHDALTGLPNRRLFLERLLTALDEARRNREKIAVVFIDLDRFKNINDTLGHEFGDLLLQHVSKQMSKCLRKNDTISRQGGDEFTIIFDKIKAKEDVIPLIEQLQAIVTKPIVIKGQELHVSMSIGIATYPKDGTNAEELMKNADMAMYCAKEEGRSTYKLFSKDMNQTISRKMTLESGLRKAISNDEFVMYYQPQVNIHTGEVVGVESLIRWNTVEAEMVSPKEFIPLAEETGLIIPIGEWVLYTACKQGKIWHDAGYSHLKVAVNLSPLQFLHEGLVDMVADVLRKTGFNPYYLELEITEGVAVEDVEQAIKKMQVLRHLGVRIAIDDFGTGYSSLIYLKRFPITSLKIAQPFIQDITANQEDRSIVEAIISIAHTLGLTVISEGAESEEQLHILKGLHCDEIQGDLFSKPLTVLQLTALIESGKPEKLRKTI